MLQFYLKLLEGFRLYFCVLQNPNESRSPITRGMTTIIINKILTQQKNLQSQPAKQQETQIIENNSS